MYKQFFVLTTVSVFMLSILAVSVYAQSPIKTGKDAHLISFGPGPDSFYVSRGEFEYVYQKNNGGWDKAKKAGAQEYKDYLNLYIKFRRKVLDAQRLGMDTMSSYINELEGYRKQLAQPYLVEKNVLDTLIREAYTRSLEMVRTSHILLTLAADAMPEDTLRIYTQIMGLRDSILHQGRDFNEMAKVHSQDPSAKTNGGDLGFFTAFNMVYPFENAAYNTPVGKISMPVRTQFGYHIVKVEDRYKLPGIQHAAHIIIRVGENYSAKDTATAVAKINEIHTRLKNGEDFATLAQQFSDDPGSAPTGGELGTTRLLPEMESWKRQLKSGQFSEPFTTPYGWHILKIVKVDPIAPFEEAKFDIKNKVQKDQRSNLPQEVFINRLKREYRPTLNEDVIQKFIQSIGKEYSQGRFTPDTAQMDLYRSPLIELGSGNRESRTLIEFLNYYRTLRAEATSGPTIEAAVRKNINSYLEQELLKYEESKLSDKYPDYRELYKEYRDGILLFALTEKLVWKKAIEDTLGLQDFYNRNKNRFTAGERFRIREYRSTDSSKMTEVQLHLLTGKSHTEIDSLVNSSSALNLRIQTVVLDPAHPDLPQAWVQSEPNAPGPIRKRDKQFVIQEYIEKLPAGVKSFEEARSECITAYQEELEKNWNAQLEKQYPAVVHEHVFKSLFK